MLLRGARRSGCSSFDCIPPLDIVHTCGTSLRLCDLTCSTQRRPWLVMCGTQHQWSAARSCASARSVAMLIVQVHALWCQSLSVLTASMLLRCRPFGMPLPGPGRPGLGPGPGPGPFGPPGFGPPGRPMGGPMMPPPPFAGAPHMQVPPGAMTYGPPPPCAMACSPLLARS